MLATALRWKNACRLNGARTFLLVLLPLAAACGLADIPQTGLVLDWLGRNVIVTGLVATCLFVLSGSRRRERAVAAGAASWLTPLPAVTSVSVASAASIALVSIASLSLAAIRVAFDAARWLGPTTLRRARFTAAMVWRVILTQALAMAVMVFLACAIDLPKALRLGVALAGGFLLASLAVATVACAWACRRRSSCWMRPSMGWIPPVRSC